jgi:hypothetical protein
MTNILRARELARLALPRMKRLAADFFEGKDRAVHRNSLSANRLQQVQFLWILRAFVGKLEFNDSRRPNQ